MSLIKLTGSIIEANTITTNNLADGAVTQNILAEGLSLSGIRISGITYPGDDTAANTAGGQSIVLTGAGFESGAAVLVDYVSVGSVTVTNSTSISFTAPAKSAGGYLVHVVNADGATAIHVPGIQYSGTPVWSTPAASVGTFYETTSVSNTVTATSDSLVQYEVVSGSLPTGASMNANGIITGTAPAESGATTFTFTVRATDVENQSTDRTFTITVNPDAVTWSAPANNSTITTYEYVPITNTFVATSAAGKSVTYSANVLPANVSISGDVVSGTPTTVGNTTSLITATADTTNKTSTETLNFVVQADSVTWSSPANNTTYTLSQNIANTVSLAANSAAGFNVSYAADTLPTGMSVSGATITGTPTTVGNTTTVVTATAATTNRTAQRTFNWVVIIASDAYWKDTVMLIGANTNNSYVKDSSLNNARLVVAGNTRPSTFTPYNHGYYSYNLDGASYILGTMSTGVTIGTNDFCLEGWGYWTSFNNGTYGSPIVSLLGATAGELMLRANKTSAATTTANFFSILGSGTYIPSSMYSSGVSAGTLYLNRWHHLAIQRVSGTWYFYVDGVQVSTTSAGDASLTLAFTRYYIGNDSGGSGGYMAGNASNVRLTVGTVPYATGGFTVPTAPLTTSGNTRFLSARSSRLIDVAGSNTTFTTSGSIAVHAAHPFLPTSNNLGSAYFENAAGYIDVPHAPYQWLGSSDFTIETWAYFTQLGTEQTLVSKQWQGAAAAYASYLIYITASNTIQVLCSTSGGNWEIQFASTATVTSYRWYHIAFTRSGSTWTVWLDGVQVATTTVSATLYNATDNLKIGTAGSQTGYNAGIKGYMADVRITKGTALYTSAFTPPTSPLTSNANTVLSTLQYNGGHTTNSVIDNSGFLTPLNKNGNTAVGAFTPYLPYGWSAKFDSASSQYISLPTAAATAFGGFNGNITTIEFWARQDSSSTTYGNEVFGTFADVAANGRWWLEIGNGAAAAGSVSKLLFTWTTSTGTIDSITTTAVVPVNKWVHIALVVDATGAGGAHTVNVYVDGVGQSFTGKNFSSQTATYDRLRIGGGYSSYFGGQLSNLRLVRDTTNRAGYSGSSIAVPTANLTAITGTKLLMFTDSRIRDASSSNITPSLSAALPIMTGPFGGTAYSPSLHSSSMYFDGNDWVSSNSTATAMTLGANDFTVEYWVYQITNNGTFQSHVGNSVSSAGFSFGSDGSANPYITTYTTGGSAGTAIALNQWHHIAWVRIGGTVKCYLDGVQVYSASWGTNVTEQSFGFGAQNNGAYPFNGYLSDIRVIKGAGIYTTAFTPPSAPLTPTAVSGSNTAMATLLVGGTTPGALNNRGTTDLEMYGTTISMTPESPYEGSYYSNYFDGSGDYLSVTGTNIALGAGDFTIEFWVNGYYSGTKVLLDWASAPQLYMSGTSLVWYWNADRISNTLVNNAWTHIALVRASGVTKMYVNGVANATTFTDATSITQQTVTIGGRAADTNNTLNGYMSNVRLVKGTAVYTTNFTPPTSPLTAISGTSLLTCQSNRFLDNSTSALTLTNAGDVATRTTNPFRSNTNKSLYFNGGSYVAGRSDDPTFGFGRNDFTIEGWIYPTSTSSYVFFDTRRQNEGKVSMGLANSAAGMLVSYSTTAIITANTGVGLNKWTHFAAVRTANTLTLYLNGAVAANASMTDDLGTTGSFCLGTAGDARGNDSYDYHGYLSDVRVTRGYARYTTTFTPPTEPYIGK